MLYVSITNAGWENRIRYWQWDSLLRWRGFRCYFSGKKNPPSIACTSLALTSRDINNLAFGSVSSAFVEGLLILEWQGFFLIPLLQMSWSPWTPLPFLSWVNYAACWILLPPISAFANVSVCHRFSCWLRWIPSMARAARTSAIFIKVEGGVRPALGRETALRKGKECAGRGRIAIERSN